MRFVVKFLTPGPTGRLHMWPCSKCVTALDTKAEITEHEERRHP